MVQDVRAEEGESWPLTADGLPENDIVAVRPGSVGDG